MYIGIYGRFVMNRSKVRIEKVVRMRCPDCLNYISAKVVSEGAVSGICPVCKSLVYSKQHSNKVKYIKIIKHTS